MQKLIPLLSILALSLTFICHAAPNELEFTAPGGEVKGKLNALLQAWGVNDSKAATSNLNYRLRRAEIKLSGTVAKDVRYFVMLDPAKSIQSNSATNDKVLQDLGIGFTLVENVEVVLGQFKTLTTAEGLASSTETILPERSLPGRTFGDKREPGAMVGYKSGAIKVGAMVSNGQSTNTGKNSTSNDLSTRVDYTVAKGITVGGFVLLGNFEYDKKGRWGINTKYNEGDLILSTEYSMGRNAGVNALGWMADVGYNFTDQLQPVVRYELFKSNVNASAISQAETLGVNYYFYQNIAKIQAAFSFLQNLSGTEGTTNVANGLNGTLATVAFQVAI